MNHCSVIFSHEYIHAEQLSGKTAIVIDTLRATTVMTTTLANGAASIRCVAETEDALGLKAASPGLILGGERHALKIPGFDLSNSPLEYTRDVVAGHDLVMTTSNGTRTLLKAAGARTVLIGCLRNAAAAMAKAISLGHDIVLVNAGTLGQFSLDDYITAGAMAAAAGDALELSDAARGARLLYEDHPGIHSALAGSLHYQRLLSLGLEADLDFCLTPNQLDVVPVFRDGLVSLATDGRQLNGEKLCQSASLI